MHLFNLLSPWPPSSLPLRPVPSILIALSFQMASLAVGELVHKLGESF